MLVLGIESSCDETAAAVVNEKREILGQSLLSQEEHKVFGGVVPEIAARSHLDHIDEIIESCVSKAGIRLEDLDAIAASEARIKECRESIHQMKGVAICPSCGASVDADAAFCSACGQKMPEKPKPEPVKEEDVEVIPPEQPSEEPASETVSENASETPTKASAPDASTEA